MAESGEGRFAPGEYLNLACTQHAELFDTGEPVWSAIGKIAPYLEGCDNFAKGGAEVSDRAWVAENVHLGDGVEVEPGAVLKGPAWIGEGTVVRAGAYLRGHVITGRNCVLGNSCEFKNCVLFDGAQVPHFNYVGDSILGHGAHLGAGVVLSNVRLDHGEVHVRIDGGGSIGSGLRKFGAVIGDGAEIGCNSVINPGSLVGRECVLYPGSMWSGVLAERHLVKVRQVQEVVKRRG